MTRGTRSLLFGVHQVLLHPVCMAVAWCRLYGRLPRDPRVWLAFVVHDWGYWGCRTMDGEDGKLHPWRGARIMSRLCDWPGPGWSCIAGSRQPAHPVLWVRDGWLWFEDVDSWLGPWGQFTLLHSRSLARRYGVCPSRLCAPDKVASFLPPAPVYLLLAWLTGELGEYMDQADTLVGRRAGISVESPWAWYRTVKAYLSGVAERLARGGDVGPPPSRSG